MSGSIHYDAGATILLHEYPQALLVAGANIDAGAAALNAFQSRFQLSNDDTLMCCARAREMATPEQVKAVLRAAYDNAPYRFVLENVAALSNLARAWRQSPDVFIEAAHDTLAESKPEPAPEAEPTLGDWTPSNLEDPI